MRFLKIIYILRSHSDLFLNCALCIVKCALVRSFMYKFFTEPHNIAETEGKILGDDVKHIYKVLRLSEGEEVILNNCEGIEYLGKIKSINKTEIIVNIIKKLDINNESKVKIHLFQGLPKGQKMDLIVQKGTELGVFEFIPIITARIGLH